MSDLYSFIYRGLLTEESLDKAGRINRSASMTLSEERVQASLMFDMLDSDQLERAKRMALVYTAIHAFENTVRDFVARGMGENFEAAWWDKVPSKIQKKVASRVLDEAKFRWHGARGGAEIEYCDFGDLSSIIVVHWDIFESILADLEWAKSTLSILERSRNIIMHGGDLELQDIERIGINIRDWMRQAG